VLFVFTPMLIAKVICSHRINWDDTLIGLASSIYGNIWQENQKVYDHIQCLHMHGSGQPYTFIHHIWP
jgi:hypothetical protein